MRRSTEALGGFWARQPRVTMAARAQVRTSWERNKQTAFHCRTTCLSHYRRARRGRANGVAEAGCQLNLGLVDQLGAIDVAGGGDASEGEVEALVVLIALRAEGETPVFHGEAATVPVVAGLHAAILQRVLVQVIAEIHAAAEAGLGTGAIAERGTDLLIVGDGRGGGGGGQGARFQGIQARMADGAEEAGMTNVNIDIAGVDTACVGIVVHIPAEGQRLVGAQLKARDERRELAGAGEEGGP